MRAFGRVHRFTAFGLCITLTGWSWWSAQASGYAGLPVNTLGQIAGDLILMGLVAPMARRDPSRDRDRGRDIEDTELTAMSSPLGALARAAHRIQLLDVRLCLPQLTDDRREAASAQPSTSSTAPQDNMLTTSDDPLRLALSSAIANDACVEILLPDPEESAGLDLIQRFGILPSLYRGVLSQFIKDVNSLSASIESGRLDLRLYAEPTNVSLVRCDHRMWVSLQPRDLSEATDYLALDQATENTQVLQAYFNRLYSNARAPKQPRGDPTDPDAGPGMACVAAAGAAVADRGR